MPAEKLSRKRTLLVRGGVVSMVGRQQRGQDGAYSHILLQGDRRTTALWVRTQGRGSSAASEPVSQKQGIGRTTSSMTLQQQHLRGQGECAREREERTEKRRQKSKRGKETGRDQGDLSCKGTPRPTTSPLPFSLSPAFFTISHAFLALRLPALTCKAPRRSSRCPSTQTKSRPPPSNHYYSP